MVIKIVLKHYLWLICCFWSVTFQPYATRNSKNFFCMWQVLDNYMDILRNNQIYLQDKSKLKNVLDGLICCMSSLASRKDESYPSNEPVWVIHSFISCLVVSYSCCLPLYIFLYFICTKNLEYVDLVFKLCFWTSIGCWFLVSYELFSIFFFSFFNDDLIQKFASIWLFGIYHLSVVYSHV